MPKEDVFRVGNRDFLPMVSQQRDEWREWMPHEVFLKLFAAELRKRTGDTYHLKPWMACDIMIDMGIHEDGIRAALKILSHYYEFAA